MGTGVGVARHEDVWGLVTGDWERGKRNRRARSASISEALLSIGGKGNGEKRTVKRFRF
jgi:hypothetical protein